MGVAALTGTSDENGGNTAGPLAPVTAPAPPHANAEAGPCAKVLAKLPLQLNRLQPRIVHTKPETPYVVAWGDPPVVLSCGVDRPRDLRPTSGAQYFGMGPANGPFYTVTSSDNTNVYTTVDRGPYIAISVPTPPYEGGDVVPPLSRAIASALPAVCTIAATAPPSQSCTHRP